MTNVVLGEEINVGWYLKCVNALRKTQVNNNQRDGSLMYDLEEHTYSLKMTSAIKAPMFVLLIYWRAQSIGRIRGFSVIL